MNEATPDTSSTRTDKSNGDSMRSDRLGNAARDAATGAKREAESMYRDVSKGAAAT